MSVRFRFTVRHDSATGALSVDGENLRPPLRRIAAGGRELIILGHPFIDGRRDDAAVCAALQQTDSIERFACQLDGGFLVLVHEPADGRLHVISDRFASYAFFYRADSVDGLSGALTPFDLAARNGTRLDDTALFEFIWLRRLLGEKTFDAGTRYLASATVLTSAADGLAVRKYWQPDYSAPRFDEAAGAAAIAEALRDGMAAQMEQTGDGRRYALFLSGGLDSRAVLAAAAQPLAAVTTCATMNNEAEVARDVANKVEAAFTFIARPERPYDEAIDDAVWLSGGQQIFTEAQFLGYGPELSGSADCFFIGLGLDIFLGGLYQPKKPVRWFGRQALHQKLTPLSNDLAGDYLGGVKYRLSTTDPWMFVRPDHRPRLTEALRASVTDILQRGEALGAAGYDLWEYLHLHNLSRHYSFPMIQSVRTWAECRAPALTNAFLDIAVRLPAEHKVNSSAYLRALRMLAPDLMAIRNANTNLPAGMPFRRQTALKAVFAASNKLAGTHFRMSPAATERSWPRPRDVLRASPVLQKEVAALPKSPVLAAIPFMDMDGVARAVDDLTNDRHDHTVGLFVLLTIDRALRFLG